PQRHRLGLLALDTDEQDLLLLVVEPDLEQSVRYQGRAHHGDEQRYIFAKQPPANFARRTPIRRRTRFAGAPVHSLTSHEGPPDNSLLPALALDLVEHRPPVIVALGPPNAVTAPKAASATVPIAFVSAVDPV